MKISFNEYKLLTRYFPPGFEEFSNFSYFESVNLYQNHFIYDPNTLLR